jgi:hypothetical protein
MTALFSILGLIIWVACIVATYSIAKSKGRGVVLWTAGGIRRLSRGA